MSERNLAPPLRPALPRRSPVHFLFPSLPRRVLDGAPIRINVTRSHTNIQRAPFPHRGRGRTSFGFGRGFGGRGDSMRGRDFSPDDRYSPLSRGRSRSPTDSRGKRRRRSSPSFSRSPYRSVSRSMSRSRSRSRSPRRGARSRSPPGPKAQGQSAPAAAATAAPAAAPPAPAPATAAGSGPASTTTAVGAELERLRQSEAERAARCRKLEGELERERIMSHELENELTELRGTAKIRDEALRRHRDLLGALSSGVGRLVAARQELKAAEDALAGMYAEASSYMERTAPEFGARRRQGGGETAGEGPSAAPRKENGEMDLSTAAAQAAMAVAYQQQYQQYLSQQAAAMAAAGGGGGGGGGGVEPEEGGWREAGDLTMKPIKFNVG